MEDLVALPGVGRKTANVVLGHALGIPGLPVDRHVLRVANRIGIAKGDDPVLVETQLTSALPPSEWTRASDTLILHGRRICKPRPQCDRCAIRESCNYYRAALGAVGIARRVSKVSPQGAAPSSKALQERRAAKPRGTGRGGGAPRQSKKRRGAPRQSK
jgi:endonuclease-3